MRRQSNNIYIYCTVESIHTTHILYTHTCTVLYMYVNTQETCTCVLELVFIPLPPQHQEVEHSLVPPTPPLLLLPHLPLHTLPVAEVCEHLHQILGHSGEEERRKGGRVREGGGGRDREGGREEVGRR